MDPQKLPPEPTAPKAQVTPRIEGSGQEHYSDSAEIPLIPWEALDHGKGHLQIAFQGQIYHLRVTRNGKLILTK